MVGSAGHPALVPLKVRCSFGEHPYLHLIKKEREEERKERSNTYKAKTRLAQNSILLDKNSQISSVKRY